MDLKAKKVVFVCVENSARSQMAEGFLREMAPHIRVQSAGTKPGATLNPTAAKVMQEVGVDITKQTPKAINPDMLKNGTVIVNMGCMDKDACPALLADDMADWQIDDPKGKDIEQVRAIRDAIRQRVRDLARTLEE